MSIKLGIPRGLFFYDYQHLFTEFFTELGIEVVLSHNSNKKILDNGSNNTVDETCLPVKIYHGHVIDLAKKVDYLFIPRIMSEHQGEHSCPKICGLPEMVYNSISDLPPIISPEINLDSSRTSLRNTFYKLGEFFKTDKQIVKNAFRKAFDKHNLSLIEFKKINYYQHELDNKKVLLLGHSYTIYDKYVNMNIISKLETNNFRVITPDDFEEKSINKIIKNYNGRLYWTFGRKIIGSAMKVVENNSVDGIIYISSFGCGLDSTLAEIIDKYIRENSRIPFMLVTIDEHTGEAGFNTRLEAFVDMLRWRDTHESNFSPYGECLHHIESHS